jgi:hypothetical protein
MQSRTSRELVYMKPVSENRITLSEGDTLVKMEWPFPEGRDTFSIRAGPGGTPL